MYVQRNIQARSFNHCSSGKAVSITYSECVFVALGIQHAMRRWPFRLCNIFVRDLIISMIFGGKKKNKICVLIYSITFFWKISHSKQNWARYDQKRISVFLHSTGYCWHILIKLGFFLERLSKNTEISNFIKKIRPVRAEFSLADRRKDRPT